MVPQNRLRFLEGFFSRNLILVSLLDEREQFFILEKEILSRKGYRSVGGGKKSYILVPLFLGHKPPFHFGHEVF